jgi:CheY-like chemotaxis protein
MKRKDPILVVDDDEDIRESLRDLLEEDGFPVLTASHGEEALAKLRTSVRPCLIILDLMMPIMDGYQFHEALKADPALRKLPVLILTAGRGSPPDGVLGVIHKPNVTDAVREMVRQYC